MENKPLHLVLEWKLTVWFSLTGTDLVAVNGAMLNKLSILTRHHAITEGTGHGFFALDA
jgi:hypothetical protein